MKLLPVIAVSLVLAGCGGSGTSALQGAMPDSQAGAAIAPLSTGAGVPSNVRISEVPAPPLTPFSGDVTVGAAGAPWLDYTSGVIQYADQTFRTYPYPNTSPQYYSAGTIIGDQTSNIFSFVQQYLGQGMFQNSYARLDSARQYTVVNSSVPYPTNGNDAILGPDGRIWAGGGYDGPFGREGFITAIDRTTLKEQVVSNPFFKKNYILTVNTLAVGSDGAVWVYAENAAVGTPHPTLFRFAVDMTLTKTIALQNVRIGNMTTGKDGNLWFTDYVNNAVGKLTLAGQSTEYPLPTKNATPLRIVAGDDGALWFTENSASKIGRVTLAGNITEYNTPTANSGPGAIVPGASGRRTLWFVESGQQATVNNLGKVVY